MVKLCFDNRSDSDNINIPSHVIASYIKGKVEKYYGEFGVASLLRFGVKYFNEKTKLCIIQISHGPHRFVTSILPLLTIVSILYKISKRRVITISYNSVSSRRARNQLGTEFSTLEAQ